MVQGQEGQDQGLEGQGRGLVLQGQGQSCYVEFSTSSRIGNSSIQVNWYCHAFLRACPQLSLFLKWFRTLHGSFLFPLVRDLIISIKYPMQLHIDRAFNSYAGTKFHFVYKYC